MPSYKPTDFPIKHGLIVWLDDCPPLDDDRDKRRPIIVVEPNVGEKAAIVVACSATAGQKESDAIALPNRAEQPQCKTGLPKPCHAIPRWFLPILIDDLKLCEYSGTLSGRVLRRVLSAYLQRRDVSDKA